MRRKRFGCVLSGTFVARIFFLVLLPIPLAPGATAKLVLEDGRPFPAVPLALPALTENSCRVHEIGLDGRILYSGPPAEYVPSDVRTMDSRVTDVCQAAFLVKGYGKITVTLRDGALIVVKRSDERAEGTSISVATLQAPRKLGKLGKRASRLWTTRNGRRRKENSGGRLRSILRMHPPGAPWAKRWWSCPGRKRREPPGAAPFSPI
jgi:hypothetical protein